MILNSGRKVHPSRKKRLERLVREDIGLTSYINRLAEEAEFAKAGDRPTAGKEEKNMPSHKCPRPSYKALYREALKEIKDLRKQVSDATVPTVDPKVGEIVDAVKLACEYIDRLNNGHDENIDVQITKLLLKNVLSKIAE